MTQPQQTGQSPWWMDHLDELVAAFLCVAGFIAICLHIDSEVKSITALATGWLFKSGWGVLSNKVKSKNGGQ